MNSKYFEKLPEGICNSCNVSATNIIRCKGCGFATCCEIAVILRGHCCERKSLQTMNSLKFCNKQPL